MSDDESIYYSPPLFTPPPVAPLPPPPPFSRSAVTSTTNGLQWEKSVSSFSNDPVSDGQRAYKYARGVIPDSLENYTCISYQRQVEPLIQSGPQCGIVALAMADSILNKDVSVDQISETSVTNGFSVQGEIFSSANMESLSEQTFGCKTSVLDIRDVAGKWEFLNCLARGDIMLVPYDPDKNYVPVLKKGHKAHWALVTGFFAAVNDENVLQRFQRGNLKQDTSTVNLYHIDNAPLPPNTPKILPAEPNDTPRALSANVPTRAANQAATKRGTSARTLPPEPTTNLSHPAPPTSHESTKLSHDIGDLPQQEQKTKPPLATALTFSRNPLEAAAYILVYAKQGKSQHTGIWNAKTLVESCCNLIEIDPERMAEGDNMVFPEKGIAEELCGKVVVLHMKN